MDHEQDRQKDDNGLYWKHSTDTVMQPLLDALNQAGYTSTLDEVAQIVGITEVNNCEIYNPDGLTGIRGLFPVTSLMSHKYAGLLYSLMLLSILAFYFSCVPNCRIIQHHEQPYKSYCMAAKRIMKGEELTITYTNLLMPTFMRRQKLKENWYFDCACQRCGDRSEFGTCVSAIRCGQCENR